MAKPIRPQELTGLVSLDQAIAGTVFENEFKHLQKGLEDQKNLSWQIVIGVAVAFLLVTGTVVVETILFHGGANDSALQVQQDIDRQLSEIRERQTKLEAINDFEAREVIQENIEIKK